MRKRSKRGKREKGRKIGLEERRNKRGRGGWKEKKRRGMNGRSKGREEKYGGIKKGAKKGKWKTGRNRKKLKDKEARGKKREKLTLKERKRRIGYVELNVTRIVTQAACCLEETDIVCVR